MPFAFARICFMSGFGSAVAPSGTLHVAGLIDLDATLFIHLVLFLTLVFVLPGLIFEPLLARLEQREERTAGARSDADHMRHSADAEVKAYEDATNAAKKRAMDERGQLRMAASKTADAILDKAREDSSHKLEAGVTTLTRSMEAARVELHDEAARISLVIAKKVVEG